MSEPDRQSDGWAAWCKREVERDKAWKREASEFTTNPLPPRINGPAYILMCQGGSCSGTNSLLMVPVGPHYDEMIVLAEWRMVDPDSTALLETLWTADEFPSETALWSGLFSHAVFPGTKMDTPLGIQVGRNTMKLRFLGMSNLTAGFRLHTYPSDAKLHAKIRVLMLGGEKERES